MGSICHEVGPCERLGLEQPAGKRMDAAWSLSHHAMSQMKHSVHPLISNEAMRLLDRPVQVETFCMVVTP